MWNWIKKLFGFKEDNIDVYAIAYQEFDGGNALEMFMYDREKEEIFITVGEEVVHYTDFNESEFIDYMKFDSTKFDVQYLGKL